LILVLAPDCPQDLLAEICSAVERLGWKPEVSPGTEQTVVVLAGSGNPRDVRLALARHEVDVIPLLSNREYSHLRARRRLMAGLATGLGLLIALAAGIPALGFLRPPRVALSNPEVVEVATVDDLELGAAKAVLFRDSPVQLVRLDHDRFFALSSVCTYMNVCRLEWDAERRLMICPCHGGAFDVHGNIVRGPPSVPLQTYIVERVGDGLFLRRRG